jgi:aryl-alcohol dehydrogenase-like predicted oxidoreductase
MSSRILQRAAQLSQHMSPYGARKASSTSIPNVRLNTGASMPALGFGTWQDADEQEPAILAALAAGYRHIDTARIYGTEPAVGAAIRKSGVPRNEIFVTTKLWNNKHHPDDVEGALDASLKDLGMDYVDLYLMVRSRRLHYGVGSLIELVALACCVGPRRRLVSQSRECQRRQDRGC